MSHPITDIRQFFNRNFVRGAEQCIQCTLYGGNRIGVIERGSCSISGSAQNVRSGTSLNLYDLNFSDARHIQSGKRSFGKHSHIITRITAVVYVHRISICNHIFVGATINGQQRADLVNAHEIIGYVNGIAVISGIDGCVAGDSLYANNIRSVIAINIGRTAMSRLNSKDIVAQTKLDIYRFELIVGNAAVEELVANVGIRTHAETKYPVFGQGALLIVCLAVSIEQVKGIDLCLFSDPDIRIDRRIVVMICRRLSAHSCQATATDSEFYGERRIIYTFDNEQIAVHVICNGIGTIWNSG